MLFSPEDSLKEISSFFYFLSFLSMVPLTKGATLNLVKADGSALSKVRVGLSWDVAPGVDADLDLFVVSPSKQVAYFLIKFLTSNIKFDERIMLRESGIE